MIEKSYFYNYSYPLDKLSAILSHGAQVAMRSFIPLTDGTIHDLCIHLEENAQGCPSQWISWKTSHLY